jgi:hypothetical protein
VTSSHALFSDADATRAAWKSKLKWFLQSRNNVVLWMSMITSMVTLQAHFTLTLCRIFLDDDQLRYGGIGYDRKKTP